MKYHFFVSYFHQRKLRHLFPMNIWYNIFFTFILLVWLSIMSDSAARFFKINSVLIWFLDYQPYQYGSMLTLNRYGSLADLKKAYDAKKKREKASFGSRLAASCQHLATGTTQKLFNKLTISSKWSFDQMLKCRRSKFKVTLEFSNKISKIQRLSLFGISSSQPGTDYCEQSGPLWDL